MTVDVTLIHIATIPKTNVATNITFSPFPAIAGGLTMQNLTASPFLRVNNITLKQVVKR